MRIEDMETTTLQNKNERICHNGYGNLGNNRHQQCLKKHSNLCMGRMSRYIAHL